MSSMLSDKEIIHALKQKEERLERKVLRQLYLQNYSLILNLVITNKGTEKDAISVYHNGLVKFTKNVRHQNFMLTSKLNNYLYSICRNIWLNKLRNRKPG